MQKYVIDSNFIFFNEETTPFLELFNCDTKVIVADYKDCYNSINKWLEIREEKDTVFVTFFPTVTEHGKLFICPPISKDSALAFGCFLTKMFSKKIHVTYIVNNASDNSLNKKFSEEFDI